MMSLSKLAGAVAFTTLATTCAAFAQDEYTAPLTELANSAVAAIAADPVIVAAVKAQNATTGAYDQAKIDELDTQWRSEVDAAAKPLIDATLANDASKFLVAKQDESAGVFTEIFVTDAKGLNVAQSTVTSDYWQGDEDKFTKSFGAGAGAVFLGEIEQDESTQAFQSQVSVTVSDPDTKEPIGSITVGVDLSVL